MRAQEEAADRAAVKFLNATGQSAKGMYETFKRFADDILIVALARRPLPADRIRCRASASPRLEDLVKTSPYWDKNDPPELQLRHDMMRAKLAGFLERPGYGRAALSARPTPACRRAMRARSRPIASAACASAVAQIDALIQTQPNNPYFHELKGQALLEGAQPGRGDRAAAPRRGACAERDADPHHARPGAGRDRRQPSYSDEAISLLRVAMQREPDMPGGLFAARHGAMAARATMRKPTSPRRRRRSRAAT